MHTLFTALVWVHTIVAFLILVGYALVLGKKPLAVPTLMVWSARVQLLLGLVAVGLAEGAKVAEVGHAWVAVKLVVALAIVACLEIARAKGRRGEAFATLVHVAAGLTVLNILVAYLWH